MTRTISMSGIQLLHSRLAEVEKQVVDLQENFHMMRTVLEMIREAVAPPEEEQHDQA